ncbi:MAG: hypothetical protein WEC59_12365 [Salibacteraceae bacterium]
MSNLDTSSPNRSKTGNRNFNRWLFFAVVALLALLLVQSVFRPIREIPLAGAQPQTEIKSWTDESWFSAQFQRNVAEHSGLQFAFRPMIVRLFNQLRFSLFGEHTSVITIGEDGYYFETAYRASVCGLDFLGEEKLLARLDSLDRFRDQLLRKGKRLVIMIAPNKWRTLRKRISWNCERNNAPTNYGFLMPQLQQRGYAVYDGVDLFCYDHDNGAEHPLHSKQGTHWSLFGAALSMDYLRFAFSQEGIKLPEVEVERLDVSDEPRHTDRDLHDLLNIMAQPKKEQLAYPVLSFEGNYKPKVTVIGDSYYWSYYYLGAHQGLFGNGSKFFYYNRSMIGDDSNAPRLNLSDSLRKQEINTSDAVLLVMSEASLTDVGFGIHRVVLDE